MSDPERTARTPERKLSFRAWLCSGGAGHEDGEDGIRACTLTLTRAIEMVDEYVEYLGQSYWIAVEERLPKPGEWVLVVWNGHVQRMLARLDEDLWEWSDYSADRAPLKGMSHWMPLPAAPAESAKGE